MPQRTLEQLASNALATACRHGQDCLAVGPFRAFLSPDPADQLSFAMPAEPVTDWPPAIARVASLFAENKRRLRVDYFNEIFPQLSMALETERFVPEASATVMLMSEGHVRAFDQPDGTRVDFLKPDDPALEAFLAVQAQAWDQPLDAPDAAWRGVLQAGLASGSIIAALSRVDGRPAAAGCLLRTGDIAELQGVGTVPELRHRGHGGYLSYRLVSAYFAGGDRLCWLSADSHTYRIYRALGFQPIGTRVRYAAHAS